MIEWLLANSLVTGMLSLDPEKVLYSIWESPRALLTIAILIGLMILFTRPRVS
jgi:hypothetical protein